MKVFKFWCEPASKEDRALLFDQCRLFLDYRRDLAKAENDYRDESDRLHMLGVAYKSAHERVEALLAVEPDARGETWKADLRTASAARSAAGKARRAEPDYKAALAEAQAKLRDQEHARRYTFGPKGLGLGFGSYWLADDSHSQSVEKLKPYDRLKVKLQYGEGVAVASYNSRDAPVYADILNGDCRFVRIGPLTSRGGDRRDGQPRAKRLRLVEVRLTGGKSAKWLRVYALLHREPPPDTVVVSVRVHQVRVGPKFRWSLQMVLKLPDEQVAAPFGVTASPDVGRTVGVDLGWRLDNGGGIQVAVAVDARGNERRLIVPHAVVRRGIEDREQPDGKSRCATLRSTRDKLFEKIREALKGVRATAPEWFRQETAALHAWNKPKRAARLLRLWRGQRWDGDDLAFCALERWKKQDDHLWAWEANNRAKMTRQIDGLYHAFAAQLARDYTTIKIENLNIAEAKKDWRERAADEFDRGDRGSKATVADQRSALSVARLQKIIEQHAVRAGVSLGKVEKAYTSRRCECGHVNDECGDRVLMCAACGRQEDRDVRAARNIASAEVLEWLAGPLAVAKSAASKRKRSNRRKQQQAEVAAAA